jgi:hypothetical protein
MKAKHSQFILLLLMMALFECCRENGLRDCSAPPNENVKIYLDSILGNGAYCTECYHDTSQYELGLAKHIDSSRFAVVDRVLGILLKTGKDSAQHNLAFTIYTSGALHRDSNICFKQVAGISRYYFKRGNLYHQLFGKGEGGKFKELEALRGEVDGVIFNYIRTIETAVLKVPTPSSALFIEIKHPKLYAGLLANQDNLKVQLERYHDWEDGTRR